MDVNRNTEPYIGLMFNEQTVISNQKSVEFFLTWKQTSRVLIPCSLFLMHLHPSYPSPLEFLIDSRACGRDHVSCLAGAPQICSVLLSRPTIIITDVKSPCPECFFCFLFFSCSCTWASVGWANDPEKWSHVELTELTHWLGFTGVVVKDATNFDYWLFNSLMSLRIVTSRHMRRRITIKNKHHIMQPS